MTFYRIIVENFEVGYEKLKKIVIKLEEILFTFGSFLEFAILYAFSFYVFLFAGNLLKREK